MSERYGSNVLFRNVLCGIVLCFLFVQTALAEQRNVFVWQDNNSDPGPYYSLQEACDNHFNVVGGLMYVHSTLSPNSCRLRYLSNDYQIITQPAMQLEECPVGETIGNTWESWSSTDGGQTVNLSPVCFQQCQYETTGQVQQNANGSLSGEVSSTGNLCSGSGGDPNNPQPDDGTLTDVTDNDPTCTVEGAHTGECYDQPPQGCPPLTNEGSFNGTSICVPMTEEEIAQQQAQEQLEQQMHEDLINGDTITNNSTTTTTTTTNNTTINNPDGSTTTTEESTTEEEKTEECQTTNCGYLPGDKDLKLPGEGETVPTFAETNQDFYERVTNAPLFEKLGQLQLPSGGSCPVFPFNITLFGNNVNYQIDIWCQLGPALSVISIAMLCFFGFMGIRIIMSA